VSVLVKGMDMPIGNCEWLDEYGHFKRCKLLNGEDCCKMQEHLPEVSTWQEQYARCPLVDVPTPHGRLIDADALIANHFSDEHRIALSYANKVWMRKIINNEPTVIEADVQ